MTGRCLIHNGTEHLIYLFEISGIQFYFCDSDDIQVTGNCEYLEPWIFRSVKPQEMAFAIATARHICAWYTDHRFCGQCGARMEHDEKERMMSCPECGNHVYPVISPAVIVAVTDGDRLLLTRYASRPGTPSALVAGFNEVGETIEETVAREVMEETGLHITNLRYFGSQPWPYPCGLMVGFTADYDYGKIHLQRSELSKGAWFDRDHLPHIPEKLSIARQLIDAWLEDSK